MVYRYQLNERAMMKNESGENVYINTDQVLPKNPKVLSNTYGSLWEDTIKTTDKYIYGIDTVVKKYGELMAKHLKLYLTSKYSLS